MPRPAWRDRRNGVREAESVDLNLIGCRFNVYVPPVDPKPRCHEGPLLPLYVFGVCRQSKELGLPLRNRRGLVRTRERHRGLGDFYLKRRR